LTCGCRLLDISRNKHRLIARPGELWEYKVRGGNMIGVEPRCILFYAKYALRYVDYNS
jgi:hypothetical protein